MYGMKTHATNNTCYYDKFDFTVIAFVGLELYYWITDQEDVGVVEVCSVVVYKTQCCLSIPHTLDFPIDACIHGFCCCFQNIEICIRWSVRAL